MTDTDDATVFVETHTEYDTESDPLDCDHPIELHIGGISQQMATLICQKLSLFVETHDQDAYELAIRHLDEAVSDPEAFAVEVGGPDEDAPDDCRYPIHLEIEGISSDDAHQIVGRLNQLAYEGFRGPLVSDLHSTMRHVTKDQPRSLVRLVKNDGTWREALEWHTDTDAALESADQ